MRADAAVADAVVVAREDTPGDQRLVAYYVPQDGSSVDVQVLRDTIRTQLPAYMVPTNFVHMAALPLTPNKKVDRNALPPPGETKPQAASAPARNVVVPQAVAGPSLALVRRYWEEVLKTPDLPTDRTFFDCGGNSLLLLQLHKKLIPHRADLRLTDLFRHPTIESLASYLGDNTDSTLVADDASRRALARRSALAGRRPVHV